MHPVKVQAHSKGSRIVFDGNFLQHSHTDFSHFFPNLFSFLQSSLILLLSLDGSGFRNMCVPGVALSTDSTTHRGGYRKAMVLAAETDILKNKMYELYTMYSFGVMTMHY